MFCTKKYIMELSEEDLVVSLFLGMYNSKPTTI